MKSAWILAAALLLSAVPLAAPAADAPAKAETKAKAAALTAGEVKKVDREAKKLTIQHGPIENLGMPPMTMVFRVKDAAMLDGLEAGSKIRFHAEEVKGGYLVTRLQKAK
ncbi:MAG: copper-binding protein [Betaproteobacteria bacterium]|nr:copper-binding protein [Betaproteobacteria bacterium]PWB59663.1 MAG: RND transporter [Betaproteobacteria bacterium]